MGFFIPKFVYFLSEIYNYLHNLIKFNVNLYIYLHNSKFTLIACNF